MLCPEGLQHKICEFGTHVSNSLSFPVPPLAEQHQIVAHIASETGRFDRLRTAAETTVALLKERRDALIAAAVNGEIDLGGMA